MAAEFYDKVGSKHDLMSALQKSMFESYALYHITQEMQKKELDKQTIYK